MHYHRVSSHVSYLSFYNNNIFIGTFFLFPFIFQEFNECLNGSHSLRNFPADQNVKRRISAYERQSNQNGWWKTY